MTVHCATRACRLTPPAVVVSTSFSAIADRCGGEERGDNRVYALTTPVECWTWISVDHVDPVLREVNVTVYICLSHLQVLYLHALQARAKQMEPPPSGYGLKHLTHPITLHQAA